MAQVTRADNNGDFTIKTGTANANGKRTVGTGNLNTLNGSGITNVLGTGSNPQNYKVLHRTLPVVDPNNTAGDGTSSRLAELRAMLQNSWNNSRNSINKSYDVQLGNLKNYLGQINDDYQRAIDQNEIERRKTMRSMNTGFDNRGQFGTGMGRQDMLNTDIRYGNTNSSILADRENTRAELRNLREQLEAERKMKLAEVDNEYSNKQMQLM